MLLRTFSSSSRTLNTQCISAARNASTSAIKRLAIIGGGQMGGGIAVVSAMHGLNVSLFSRKPEKCKALEKLVTKNITRMANKKFKDTKEADNMIERSLSKIKIGSNLETAVDGVDLVIEAIAENLEQKQSMFANLEKIVNPNVIFASNTSSLLIKTIAAKCEHKDRFGGLHFFNPVVLMPLVEVIKSENTSQATSDSLMKFTQDIGKIPVSSTDTPGFIVNRLLIPYMFEAVRMLDRGNCSREDIDTAMKLGAGYPMGPFQLADYI
eukprot:Ihof_evm3s293 gene=Ihof_evmTU3s293